MAHNFAKKPNTTVQNYNYSYNYPSNYNTIINGFQSGLLYIDAPSSYGASSGQSEWDGSSTLYLNMYDTGGADNYSFLQSICSLPAGSLIIYRAVNGAGYKVFYVNSGYWNGTYFVFSVTDTGGSGTVTSTAVGIDFELIGLNGTNGNDGANGFASYATYPLYDAGSGYIAVYYANTGQDGVITNGEYNSFVAKLDDAPYDGNYYVRQNSSWVVNPVDTLSAVLSASSITPIGDSTYTFDVTTPNTSIAITTQSGIITGITII